jgi:hypothetical protein
MTDHVRSHQQAALVAYAITWPDPIVRASQLRVQAGYAITWPDPVVVVAQASVLAVYDLDLPPPDPSGGGATLPMLCRVL